MEEIIIAIDPGREKCGFAVLGEKTGVISKGIVPASDLKEKVNEIIKSYSPSKLILGKGTFSKQIYDSLTGLIDIEFIDEDFTTLEARKKYFQENPRQGLWRLLPLCLQTPPCPYDDYVAVLIGERYIKKQKRKQ